MINAGKGDIVFENVTASDVQAVAFSVVGVVLIILAIPKLVQILSNLYALEKLVEDNAAARFTASILIKTLF